MPRVLIAEDDRVIANAMATHLRGAGMDVEWADNGDAALRKLRFERPDVAVIDLMLPGEDGWRITEALRSEGATIPIIMISARGSEHDKVHGLRIGADDYLAKPFEFSELLARIRALVRRGHQQKDPILRCYDLEIDTAARTVRRAGTAIHLTPREYALLEFLAFHRGKVVTRSMIWEHLYDEYDENTSNVVDVYIRYLRGKIDRPFGRESIETVRGAGYRLREDGG